MHTACVVKARRAGRLPLRDEVEPRRPGLLARLLRRADTFGCLTLQSCHHWSPWPTSESDGAPKQDVDQYHTGRESWFIEGTERPAEPEDRGPQRTIHEPARETPVYEETDVLVVGGGPAGCAAAVAARRLGAKVTLVERYNHLGGLSTGGLVIWIDRMSDWEGRQIITGFASEILERLPADAVAGAPQEQWGSREAEQVAHWRERLSAFRDVVTWSPMIDPEWLKYESVELLEEVGARLSCTRWVVDAIVDGQRAARRDLREQGGPARDPGQGRRRHHRRPRRLRRRRRAPTSPTSRARAPTSSTASTPRGRGRGSTSPSGWRGSARTPRTTARCSSAATRSSATSRRRTPAGATTSGSSWARA